ncbi:unnamed protein product [Orchesella dallaii]|uniref:Heat shock 70 kDa protein n=1 Tax=Orchesella dallaii TaxID=48710 RepID=A0ABP1S0W7_9HEXA
MLETFSCKYQRKLSTFMEINSFNATDESTLQYFHTKTTHKLLDEYDGAEKPGNSAFKNGNREQILEKIKGMYFSTLTDHRKVAEETTKIEYTIAKLCEDYTRVLNQKATKIHTTTELKQAFWCDSRNSKHAGRTKMANTSEAHSPTNFGWNFRKEMVVKLRGKLKPAFIEAGWKELLSENEGNGVYATFCEDDQIIRDLVNKTLRSLILEHCPREEDPDLKSVLEAESNTFLTTVLETNQKHREQCITCMNKMLETFSCKYQRKLHTFTKITSSTLTDESALQSFHTETARKLCDEYDGAEKPGNAEFQNGYQEMILERFKQMYLAALTDHRKIAEEASSKIQDTIGKHCENYSRLLNEEAIKIKSTTELEQIHQNLSEAIVMKFKLDLSLLGTIQYNFAELKLTESLNHAYQKILLEISKIVKKNKKICKEEVEAGIVKYKSEMKTAIQCKPISEDRIDLSVEHQRVFESVLSDFDSRLTNEDDSFSTKNLKSCFKERLEMKLLNELAAFEKEWEANSRIVQLEVQEHLSNSRGKLQQALWRNTCAASKLEDIQSLCKIEIAAARDRFHQRFPNLSKKYRQLQWKQFVSKINEKTEKIVIDRMEAKYEKLMTQSISQNPYMHGVQLHVSHELILNLLLSHSNESALHQQLKKKMENAYKNIQKEEVKVFSELSKTAASLSEKLLLSHSSKIFKKLCDGGLADEIEDFRKEDSQNILQQYKEILSWADSTNANTNLLRELEIGLNTTFGKARLAIEQLETFYNEYYGQEDLSSENIMIPPAISQEVHDKACSSAISKCIEENLLADEHVLKTESKTFLNKKFHEKLADATVIGMNFGAEYCKSAVHVNGKIQMIPHYDESGEEFSSMATYLGVGDCDGLVGQHAKSKVEQFSEFRRIVWNFKWICCSNITNYNRWINQYSTWKIGETRGTVSIDGTTYHIATDLSKLFQKLKKNAEKFLNHSVKNCVVTVDHHFDESAKCDIVKAIELAGFTGVTLLEECGSAVLLFKHIVNLQILNKKVILLDFGTVFKYYALEVSETDYTMLSNKHYLYGGAIIHDLVEYCIKEFCTVENVKRSELDSDVKFNYQKQRVWIACEKAIKSLSVNQIVKIRVSKFYKGKDLCAEITLVQMEEILKPCVTNVPFYLSVYLREARLSLENIDEIIISGGFSRFPLIQKTLTSYFQGRPLNNLNVDPDEVFAHGAAIKGAILAANHIRDIMHFKTN